LIHSIRPKLEVILYSSDIIQNILDDNFCLVTWMTLLWGMTRLARFLSVEILTLRYIVGDKGPVKVRHF
jgi:hypothetical protein